MSSHTERGDIEHAMNSKGEIDSFGHSGIARIDSLVDFGSLQHVWRLQKRLLLTFMTEHVLDLRQIGVA